MSEEANTRSGAATAVAAVRRRWGLVLACLVIVPAVAVAVSLSQDKEYEATASLLFRQPKIDEVVAAGTIFADLSDPNRFGATNIEMIGLNSVARRTALRLDLPSQDVAEAVEIIPAGQSDVAHVTATDTSPAGAAQLANTYAEAYIQLRERADHSLIRRNIAILRGRFEELSEAERVNLAGNGIQDRISRLELIDDVELGGVQVVDRATPPAEASAPKPVRNGVIGLVLGALLGLALALLLERLNRQLRSPEDVEAAYGGRPMARIPTNDALTPAAEGEAELGEDEADALRSLRTKVRHSGPGEGASPVLITSAIPGEGRTTIAWDLAAISAALGLSVLLLEADLEHPSLAGALDMPGEPGLAQVLADEAPFERLVHPVEADVLARFGDGGGSVDVLVAGTPTDDSIDLIDGKRMQDLVLGVQERYDLVVIDSPAASISDAFLPLAKMAGAVVAVGRAGKLPRRSARALSERLRAAGIQPRGVVVNGVPPPKHKRGRGERRREDPAREVVAAK